MRDAYNSMKGRVLDCACLVFKPAGLIFEARTISSYPLTLCCQAKFCICDVCLRLQYLCIQVLAVV